MSRWGAWRRALQAGAVDHFPPDLDDAIQSVLEFRYLDANTGTHISQGTLF